MEKQRKEQFLGHCPVCKIKLRRDRASLLEKRANADVSPFYSECGRCGASQIIMVFRNAIGVVTTMGVLTDLRKKDIKRFAGLLPVSANEVVEVHEWFEKH